MHEGPPEERAKKDALDNRQILIQWLHPKPAAFIAAEIVTVNMERNIVQRVTL